MYKCRLGSLRPAYTLGMLAVLGCSGSDDPESTGILRSALNCQNPGLTAAERNRCDVAAEIKKGGNYNPNQALVGELPNPTMSCSYFPSKTRSDFGKLMAERADDPGLFPGAILPVETASTGILNPAVLSGQNRGGDVSLGAVTLAAGKSTYAQDVRYGKGQVQDAVNKLLSEGNAIFGPDVSFSFYSMSEMTKLAVNFNLSIEWLRALFKHDTTENRKQLLMTLNQKFYSVSVPHPDLTEFFDDSVTTDTLRQYMSSSRPLLYVSQVNYGREMYVHIKSVHSEKDIQAALGAAINQVNQLKNGGKNSGSQGTGGAGAGGAGGAGAGGAGAGGTGGTGVEGLPISLAVDHQKVLDEMSIEFWQIGGGPSLPITGMELVKNLLNGTQWESLSQGNIVPKPISYTLNLLANGAVVKTGSIHDFYVADCTNNQRAITLNDQSVVFEDAHNSKKGRFGSYSYTVTNPNGDKIIDSKLGRTGISQNQTFGLGSPKTLNFDANLTQKATAYLKANDTNVKRVGLFDWLYYNYNQVDIPVTWQFENGVLKENSVAPRSRTPATMSEIVRQTNSLRVRLKYRLNREVSCPSQPGQRKNGGGQCVNMGIYINDLAEQHTAACISEPIVVNVGKVYETRQFIESIRDRYAVRLTETNPFNHTDASGLLVNDEVTIGEETTLTPGRFDLRSWSTAVGSQIQPGKEYKVEVAEIDDGYVDDNFHMQPKFVYIRPIAASFTVDGVQSASHNLEPSAPLVINAGASCSANKDYRVRLVKLSNGSVGEGIERVLEKAELSAFAVRSLTDHHGWQVNPGDTYRLTVSVRDMTSSWVSSSATLNIKDCATGETWTGSRCVVTTATQLKNAASQQCVAQSGSQLLAGACTAGNAQFELLPVEDAKVLIRVPGEGRCLSAEGGPTLPVVLKDCKDTNAQRFELIESEGLATIENQQLGKCLALGASLGFGSCTPGAANQFVFDWLTAGASFKQVARWAEGPSGLTNVTDGTLLGSAQVSADGKSGSALLFNGGSDGVAVHSSVLNVGTSDFAVAAWVRTTDTSGTKVLIEKRGAAGMFVHGYGLHLVNGQVRAVMNGTTWGQTVDVAGSQGFIADGKWHHVALTVNRRSQNGARIYVDGVLRKADSAQRLKDVDLNNPNPLFIGRGSATGTALVGTLDEIEVFTRSLEAHEIIARASADPVKARAQVKIRETSSSLCIDPRAETTAGLADCAASSTGYELQTLSNGSVRLKNLISKLCLTLVDGAPTHVLCRDDAELGFSLDPAHTAVKFRFPANNKCLTPVPSRLNATPLTAVDCELTAASFRFEGLGPNLARLGVASAQSTFSGYAPGHVNDGDASTAQESGRSWTNADSYGPDGRIPQWLELSFASPQEFAQLRLFTSEGYAISSYDVVYWDGSAWQPLTEKRNNSALEVEHSFAPIRTTRLRVIGLRGPSNQPQYVRINELELY